MNKILKKGFYNRNTLTVAKELLGKFIVRKIGNKKLVGKIVEVEAYNGPKDLASHASRGKTLRNAIMFGHAGHSYVYMIYGMHYCFNIVTGDYGYPAAVLIRAVEITSIPRPLSPSQEKGAKSAPLRTRRGDGGEASGPGKFCRAFKIGKKINGIDITTKKNGLWIEEKKPSFAKASEGKATIVTAKCIGVDYAGQYKDKLWRFYIKGNGWVSKSGLFWAHTFGGFNYLIKPRWASAHRGRYALNYCN